MTPLDRQLFLAINHGLHCGVGDFLIGYSTWLGFGWISYPIAVLALLALGKRQFRTNTHALAASAIVGGIVLHVVKNAVHAARPLAVFASDITAGKVYVNVMFERLYQNSFPSGHTQIAFTVATVLLWAFARAGKLKWWGAVIILGVASLIGVSRIYVGAHFPSDVLGGAVLGSGTAMLCCLAISRLQIKRPG